MAKKYFGYIRVSTLEQANKGAGAEAQADIIDKWAQLHGHELEHVYKDMGVSGAKNSRPEFNKLLAKAEAEAGVIVTAYLSRFGRNLRDLLNNVAKLDKAGVQLVAVRDNIDTGASGTGRLMLNILGAVAEYERELTRERIMGGKAAKEAAGTFYNGSPPFGYVYSKQNFEFIKHGPEYVASLPEKKRPDYAEAEIYQRIVSMYLEQGLSFNKIAEAMQAEGVKKVSTAQGAKQILGRECYYTGRITRTGINGQQLTYKLPKLISPSRWAQIQQRLNANKVKPKRGNANPDRWLKNVLRCAHCGDTMKPKTRKGANGPLVYYECTNKNQTKARLHNRNMERCTAPSVQACEIEPYMWAQVTRSLTWWQSDKQELGEMLTGAEALSQKVNEHQLAANGYRAQIAKQQRAKGRLFELLEAPDFGPEQQAAFKAKLAEYDRDISQLEAMAVEAEERLAQAQQAHGNAETWQELIDTSPELLQELASQVEALSPQNKQRVIEAMLASPVEVNAETTKDFFCEYTAGTCMAILQQLAAEGALPVLNQVTRKQIDLIHRFWKLAA
jgi:putative DNA-invertase from lambdoid prophage Rac